MCIFCCDDKFMDQMMFSVNMVNTKVEDNFLILLVLKFHNFRHDGLWVIDFRSSLSVNYGVVPDAAMGEEDGILILVKEDRLVDLWRGSSASILSKLIMSVNFTIN